MSTCLHVCARERAHVCSRESEQERSGERGKESEQERVRKRGTDIPTVYLRLASASGAADGSRPIRYKFHALRASRSPTSSLSSPYFSVNGCCIIHIPPKNFRPLSTAGSTIRELAGAKAAFWCVESGRSSNSTTRSLHFTIALREPPPGTQRVKIIRANQFVALDSLVVVSRRRERDLSFQERLSAFEPEFPQSSMPRDDGGRIG